MEISYKITTMIVVAILWALIRETTGIDWIWMVAGNIFTYALITRDED